MDKYEVGQLFKNSPNDDYPYFRLIKITYSIGGMAYYRVVSLHNENDIKVLHNDEMFLFV